LDYVQVGFFCRVNRNSVGCRSPPSFVSICQNQKIGTEENLMTQINLREYYPDFYTTDCIIEVPDEVAMLMDSYEHA
jgi:RNA polymerase sigma-70 factor (ECF subfamily)